MPFFAQHEGRKKSRSSSREEVVREGGGRCACLDHTPVSVGPQERVEREEREKIPHREATGSLGEEEQPAG